MTGLLKISDAASLAIHAMAFLAQRFGKRTSAKQIASVLGVSENHLAKVCQRLAKAGLIEATRGPRGGFVLAQPADLITLIQVYEAVEGPLSPSRCLLHRPVCGENCIMGELVESVNRQVSEYLRWTTLAQLAKTSAFPAQGGKNGYQKDNSH